MGANGGNHIEEGFSSRFMWRKNGFAEVYLYVPDEQLPEYYDLIIKNEEYGHSMWRSEIKLFKNYWNVLKMCIEMNTNNKYDGKLRIIVNNVKKEYNKMLWKTKDNQKINGLMMNTFFGGSDESWAPRNTTYAQFADFEIKTI